MFNYGMNHLKMFLQFVDGLTHGLTLGVVKSLSRLKNLEKIVLLRLRSKNSQTYDL